MKSAILVRPREIELRDVGVPKAPPGGLVVRVRAALTDGTDLKAYRRGHPQMPMPTPFGHEFSGDVAAVGEGVTKFAEGQALMSVHSAPCMQCFWCGNGEEELCTSVMSTKILGAYAEYIEIPAHIAAINAYAKPAHLSYVAAAFLEPLACVVHSVEMLAPKAGARVLVMGDGGFGFLHALVLKGIGAEPMLAGRRDERAALAQRYGLPYLDVRKDDLLKIVHEVTQARGTDALVECTGQAEVWERGPQLVRRGGTVSFFGGLPSGTRVSFDAARMHYDEVRLISPFHFRPSSVRRAYDMLASGEIDPLPLVTETVPLAEIARVFERLDAGDGIKFAVTP
ncbi:MAG TPA: alcohol dehydrogenase catalytic domain-containing protein [Candidatus Baltobacteraceae bacterium]|nr:alcohol dehydrogenase catalytic domain-containing protein [Candidatus Baltobacteraceae bacterium]